MKVKPIALSLFCLLLLCAFPALGQNYRLTGLVMDKASKTPIIGAIVILKEKADSTKQYAALTNNNGRFTLTSLNSKAYNLHVQNLSYEKVIRPIVINKKDLHFLIYNHALR